MAGEVVEHGDSTRVNTEHRSSVRLVVIKFVWVSQMYYCRNRCERKDCVVLHSLCDPSKTKRPGFRRESQRVSESNCFPIHSLTKRSLLCMNVRQDSGCRSYHSPVAVCNPSCI